MKSKVSLPAVLSHVRVRELRCEALERRRRTLGRSRVAAHDHWCVAGAFIHSLLGKIVRLGLCVVYFAQAKWKNKEEDDMTAADTLAAALEREQREIDEGVEAFLAGRAEHRDHVESLRQAIDALRRHIFLEEEFLFPPLRAAGLVAPIFVMLREHGEIWDTLDVIEAQLRAGGGDGTLAVTCRALLGQLERHNSKEEPIVYPEANAVLTAGSTAELREFLAAGRIPLGWVCARAGASAHR
jgi:regulator of cell morphogenesis and NO signaling